MAPRAHPGVQVICRDRAGAYADGARDGAPGAIQVADRWHLWDNLCQNVERLVATHHACLPESIDPAPDTGPDLFDKVVPLWPDTVRIGNTRQRHDQTHELRKRGFSMRAIARKLDLNFKTVRRYLRADSVETLLAGGVRASVLDFFGASIVPPEHLRDPDGYPDLVCGPMLDAVAPLVGWVDVACAAGAFDSARARRVLAAGQRKGLGLRVHGDPYESGPATLVAVDTGAASVDLSYHLTDQDITALAGSDTAATMLPIREPANGQPPVPGRRLFDAGVSIAVASGCNPGTCYSPSMNLAVALAVMQCGLTPAEAVYSATAGGARSLHRTDVGPLTVGAGADLHVLNAPSFEYLAYPPGLPLTQAVYRHGSRVA